jgi:hypothetical protein
MLTSLNFHVTCSWHGCSGVFSEHVNKQGTSRPSEQLQACQSTPLCQSQYPNLRKCQEGRSQDPATGISCKHVSRVDTCTAATAKWHKTWALVSFPTTVSDRYTNQKKRRQTCCITSARNLANNVCHFVSLKWLVTGPAQHVNTPLVQCTIMCVSRKTPVV